MRARQRLVSSSETGELPRSLGEEVLPYQGFHHRLTIAAIGLTQEFFSGVALSEEIRDPSASREAYQKTDEISAISRHMQDVTQEVWRIRQRLKAHIEDVEALNLESDEIVSQFRKRLARYPLDTAPCTAVSVEIDDFADEVASMVGNEVAAELMDALSYFGDARGKGSGGRHHIMLRQPCSNLPVYSVQSMALPVLLITHQEYGRPVLEESTATEQRLACTSAVRFLAALGITDFPVYGLATYGPFGVACQAWYSTKHKVRLVNSIVFAPS